MRLRQRSSRSLADAWAQPRGAGRWTAVGNLDSARRGLVDPAGLVTIADSEWSLDWWIGAEDRWHLPSREVAVRQSLLGASPVVETRLRVPGGDAVHRAYAARAASGEEALIIEVENQSKVPFAVALALRPQHQTGTGRLGSIELDGTSLLIDGATALVLPKPPGRVALSNAAGGDCAATVFAGDASSPPTAAVSCDDGLAQGALLFPLAHTATLRVALALDSHGVPSDLAALPSARQVASGWGAHTAAGVRVELPDRRLRDAITASTRHLLLGGDDPAVAAALDLMGFPAEAARRLTADPVRLARTEAPGAALHAVAQHWELTRDQRFASSCVQLVAALVARLASAPPGDAALGRGAFAAAAELLDAAGETRAASDLRAMAVAPPEVGLARDLAGLLSSATSTWTFASEETGHDLTANAAAVTLALEQLVSDAHGSLALCPLVPQSWLGQGWELHRAPTRHGRLSYAVRWHGDRPALLWELEPHVDRHRVTLSAPGLDATWSTREPIGEALLARVSIPERGARRGLTIPVSIEPAPRTRP